MPEIHVIDGMLSDPVAYRALALAQPFGDVSVGPATFRNIAPAPSAEVLDWLTARFGDVERITTFVRCAPAGQIEPHYIHTDRDMGAWTGILYLTPDPPETDGTTFWRHRETGADMSTSETPEVDEWAAWRDLTQWAPWRTVPAAFNRLVLFPAACFHSRAIVENYGETPDRARLIQVMFGGQGYVSRNSDHSDGHRDRDDGGDEHLRGT